MREKGRMRPKGSLTYMFLVQLDCGECPHCCGDSTHLCVNFTHFCEEFTHFHEDSTHLCVDSTDPWKLLLGMSGLSPDCP
jgi:Zn-dependent alcohol dehydrogenase